MAAGDLGLLSECIAEYDFSASGYSGGKLIDQTSYGNDLTFVNRGSASPTFNTRDGHDVTDFDNSFYYEGKSLMNPGFSIVFTVVHSSNSVVRYLFNDFERKAASDNFDADPYENTDTDIFSSGFMAKGIHINAGKATLRDVTGSGAQSASNTIGEATLYTAYVDIANNQNKISKNTDAFSTGSYTDNVNIFNSGNMMRIGFLTADGVDPAPFYFSLIKAYIFMGDVTQNPDFAQARLDEINSL